MEKRQADSRGSDDFKRCCVCKKSFPIEEILRLRRDFVCKSCLSKWQKRQVWGPRKKVAALIVAGIGFSFVGAALLLYAVLSFLATAATIMPYVIIVVLALPCFGLGAGAFGEAWWLAHRKHK